MYERERLVDLETQRKRVEKHYSELWIGVYIGAALIAVGLFNDSYGGAAIGLGIPILVACLWIALTKRASLKRIDAQMSRLR